MIGGMKNASQTTNEQQPVYRRTDSPVDEFRGHSPAAVAGILHIRSLPDEDVLAAARHRDSDAHGVILAHLGGSLFDGGATNPYWVDARCAEEAYRRHLIDELELDLLT